MGLDCESVGEKLLRFRTWSYLLVRPRHGKVRGRSQLGTYDAVRPLQANSSMLGGHYLVCQTNREMSLARGMYDSIPCRLKVRWFGSNFLRP